MRQIDYKKILKTTFKKSVLTLPILVVGFSFATDLHPQSGVYVGNEEQQISLTTKKYLNSLMADEYPNNGVEKKINRDFLARLGPMPSNNPSRNQDTNNLNEKIGEKKQSEIFFSLDEAFSVYFLEIFDTATIALRRIETDSTIKNLQASGKPVQFQVSKNWSTAMMVGEKYISLFHRDSPFQENSPFPNNSLFERETFLIFLENQLAKSPVKTIQIQGNEKVIGAKMNPNGNFIMYITKNKISVVNKKLDGTFSNEKILARLNKGKYTAILSHTSGKILVLGQLDSGQVQVTNIEEVFGSEEKSFRMFNHSINFGKVSIEEAQISGDGDAVMIKLADLETTDNFLRIEKDSSGFFTFDSIFNKFSAYISPKIRKKVLSYSFDNSGERILFTSGNENLCSIKAKSILTSEKIVDLNQREVCVLQQSTGNRGRSSNIVQIIVANRDQVLFTMREGNQFEIFKKNKDDSYKIFLDYLRTASLRQARGQLINFSKF